ncbi:hypothetical protein [Nocardia phage NC1]|nr:hypothetical protein [Nocardia phage NC1]QSL67699.1 hypothetical protein [Nocardia phage P69]
MAKFTAEERRAARDELRRLFAPGDRIAMTLASVSRDGMSRTFTVLAPDRYRYDHEPTGKRTGGLFIRNVSYLVAQVLGESLAKNGAVRVGGCGMDMSFHLADTIGYYLYRSAEAHSELTRSQRAKVKAAMESRGNFMTSDLL